MSYNAYERVRELRGKGTGGAERAGPTPDRGRITGLSHCETKNRVEYNVLHMRGRVRGKGTGSAQ